jgi:predicted metalloprotease with PDZ domain
MRRTFAVLTLALAATSVGSDSHSTYTVDYVVRISRRDPGRAHVRWLLAGIDEIQSFRLVFRDDRTSDVGGTGRLAWQGRTLVWTPGRPYAHFRYTVAIDHRRPPGDAYDSCATPDWIATRAMHLFPEINVRFAPGATAARSRARLVFRLPAGWKSVTTFARAADGTYLVEEPGKRFDRPRGWILLGRIARRERRIAGSDVTVATAPGSALEARRVLSLYARILPELTSLLGPPPPRLLLVSAPDPMWRGGLSAEDSFFVNGRIPLRSPDRTSTYVHELFHVWQPFQAGPDGRWITEGLAEYYSLVLQHRAGRLSDAGFARGVDLFARYARWSVNLARSHDPAVLNNSAPYVLHWLDQDIRRATGGRQSLDDVVRLLAHDARVLTTAGVLRAANRVAGRNLTSAFNRHVYRGQKPALRH